MREGRLIHPDSEIRSQSESLLMVWLTRAEVRRHRDLTGHYHVGTVAAHASTTYVL
jgi:hypothetical protein